MIAWMLSVLSAAVPLVEAVKQNDDAAVRALVAQHADVNASEGDGATALHWAVYGNDAEIVDLLIAAGAKVNVANDLSITPLYLASANGNEDLVARLLDNGADPGTTSETGVTPLMEAARTGNVGAVQALLSHGANVNASEGVRGQTALMWAAARRHAVVVGVLLDHDANVRARTRVRTQTVMLDRGPRRTVKTSMRDAKQIDSGGSSALVFAAEVGDTESAKLLLDAGADVNDAAADGRSVLVAAVFGGHGDVAKVLLDRGADVNAAGAGYTALHAAVLRGEIDTAQALLANGANPNARLTKGSPVRRFGAQWVLPNTMMGATPLFVAATYLEVDIVRALLAAGGDPALGLANGTAPLLAAAGTAVQKEARPSDLARFRLVDSDFIVIPRDEADVLGAVRLLLDAGAAVNQVNEAGDSALHAAAVTGMTTVIQLLADGGAELEIENKAGQTPLALTMPREEGRPGRRRQVAGSKEAEELLRKLGATQ